KHRGSFTPHHVGPFRAVLRDTPHVLPHHSYVLGGIMFRLIWFASIHIRSFMRRWMPTNIVLDKVRTRRGLKWGIPAMLLAIPYLYTASLLTVIIRDG